MLKRREFLISTVALSAGLVGGCSKGPTAAKGTAGSRGGATTQALFFSTGELSQLAEIAEILIPATDTPGARAANVHGFIDQLMAQWAVSKTQVAMRATLDGINQAANRRFGADFLSLSAQQRVDVIAAVDDEAFNSHRPAGESVHAFVRLKELVFLGYYHSEAGATQELQYRLVPGRYEGCTRLSTTGRAWVGDQGETSLMARMSLAGATS